MTYDFIIAGSGCAGLMLAYKMALEENFNSHSILIIDKESKNSNDRTWCFWEKGLGKWDHLISNQWSQIYFGSSGFKKSIPLGEYMYKMVRGDDFYLFILDTLKQKSNFHFAQEEISSIIDGGDEVVVSTATTHYTGRKVFSSIFNPSIITNQTKYPYLKQHFVGWFVEVNKPIWNVKEATFMDFDIEQYGNTRFMYVLPLSPYKALVEYTLFSENLLDFKQYENFIEQYLVSYYGLTSYTLTDKESGNIPMTCFPFEAQNTRNVLHIGSAGGWSKPSTGYTFAMSDKNTDSLITYLKHNTNLSKFSTQNIFRYLDNVMLRVLARHNHLGADIFSSMFRKNSISRLFRFLDEEANLWEVLRVMHSVKHLSLFVKAVFVRS